MKFRSKECECEGPSLPFPQSKIRCPHLAATALCYLAPASFVSPGHLSSRTPVRQQPVFLHAGSLSQAWPLPGLANSHSAFTACITSNDDKVVATSGGAFLMCKALARDVPCPI